MSVSIQERLGNTQSQQKTAIENELANTRVAIPGIIQGFDAVLQTATVQPALIENTRGTGGEVTQSALPLLVDVPVFFPRGGGFAFTFPVSVGDECLLIFADMCIDGWWQSGGVQGQMECRRHDLSDAFALVGFTSVPNSLTDFSSHAVQIRAVDGSTFIEVQKGAVNIRASSVNIEGNLNVSGTISGG